MLFSCHNPCKKITKEPYWGHETYIRTYCDCKDTTTYIDSTFYDGHLNSVSEKYHNLRQGKWVDFNSSGSVWSYEIYEKNSLKEKMSLGDNCRKIREYKNDTVYYLKSYTLNGTLIKEGQMQGENKSGKWIDYDTVTKEKVIANYFPITKWDTANCTTYDSTTGEITLAPRCDLGVLNGKWEKYDKNGNLIDHKNYIMGDEK